MKLFIEVEYDSLQRYRDECRARAVAIAHPPHYNFTWMSPEYNWFNTDVEHECNRGGNIFIASVQGKSMMRYWWREYMYEAKRRLAMRPWGTTVTRGDFYDQALQDGSKCRECKKNLDHDFKQFTDVFASKINEAVSQARLGYQSCLSDALTFIFGIGRFRELVKVHSSSANRITINSFIPQQATRERCDFISNNLFFTHSCHCVATSSSAIRKYIFSEI